ncbi:Glutathione reductase [Gracilariopsis chorda]|uniref:Glutathione reductase n=2 Tax=Gracilariopsis TaxID=2781 RepID=A0A2V3IMP1_9FLOR|nr:Glutathione reductase [Gracilariopsis chorda]|eukprot:PXF42380.1 Glutathione reductase [Gracilariopsis chorda]
MATTTDQSTQRETLPHGFQYDLFVIGAGSGGVRASRIAATHGAKVAVAEYAPLGGTCVNVGCVPKKLFVYGSHYGHDFHDAQAYGWDVPKASLDWPRLIRNKNAEIERLNGIYGRLLDRAGVHLIQGKAKFVDSHTVQVGDKQYTADKILVAVGGRPFVPEFEGSEHVITSNEAFYLEKLPKRVVVVGGGYIAVEFACIFHGYGTEVVQLYRRDLFLRGFDDDVRKHLAEQMQITGVDLRFNSVVKKITKLDDGCFEVTTNKDETIQTDLVMYATGRHPYTADLGLKEAGVTTGQNGKILVDDWNKTNVNHIYAVGDVTDRVCLTPVAIAEGHAFADTHYGNKKRNVNYQDIPTAVFSTPSIGTCGLTETQAREKYGKYGVDIYKTSFRPMKHTLTKREGEKVFMKLIVEKSTDKVVGCHMLDAAAGEVIQLVGVAMKAGATKADFDSTMPVHPVSAEEMVTLRTKEPNPQ